MTDQTPEEALRAALLDVLTNMGTVLLTSREGRAEAARSMLDQAERAHPAVAEVFREAAERVKAMEGKA